MVMSVSCVCGVGVFDLIFWCSFGLLMVSDIVIDIGICWVVLVINGKFCCSRVFLVRIDSGVLDVVSVLMMFGIRV